MTIRKRQKKAPGNAARRVAAAVARAAAKPTEHQARSLLVLSWGVVFQDALGKPIRDESLDAWPSATVEVLAPARGKRGDVEGALAVAVCAARAGDRAACKSALARARALTGGAP